MGQILRITHRQRPELVTLSELRARTDQQLHDLIRSKLDVGLSFAVLADVEQTAGDRVFAEESLRSLVRGRRVYALVRVLQFVLHDPGFACNTQ